MIIDAETVPFIDVTSVKMLSELAEELGRSGVRLGLAKDIGQVRDLLPGADEGDSVEIYDTIDEAVVAMSQTVGSD